MDMMEMEKSVLYARQNRVGATARAFGEQIDASSTRKCCAISVIMTCSAGDPKQLQPP